MPATRHFPTTALLRLSGVWLLLASGGNAQEMFPPSRTAEQTQVPVFAGHMPDDGPQKITHPEPLANFRLVMEYRMEKPGDRLALELGPSETLELPAASDARWQRLQLRHELTARRKGLLEATVDGQVIKQASLPPPHGVKPVATFPDGVPGIPVRLALHASGSARIRSAWVQPLAGVDHAGLISSWNDRTLAEGRKIYESLCITCHGTLIKEGSLPTSRRFGREPFRNGSDPFRIYQTIARGYGQMAPMPQYTPAQTYAVIQYIRETFLAPHRPEDMTAVDDAYLASLPRMMTTLRRESAGERPPPFYLRMDFGPALHWTYQVAPGNIACKALATRLDPGPGGIGRGKAWIVHDLDMLAVAAVTGGSFIDWRGIAFDGSHGTHTSLTGKSMFANPVGPGWANPADGSWDDPRPLGRDGKPYGPLPREWARFLGTHIHGQDQILRYSVGDALILEVAECPTTADKPSLVRTLNIGRSSHDLKHRIAPVSTKLAIRSSSRAAEITEESGFIVLKLPAARTPADFRIAIAPADDAENLDSLLASARIPLALEPLTHGGPPRWPQVLTTRSVRGEDTGAFAVDAFEHPDDTANPWQSRMQLSGFDFFSDGKRAAVCTWLGDVWIVEGIERPAPAELRWRRIASGLFQPLGLKIIDDVIHVGCRDQIARLHDRNGDGETDFIECFNNDHQVTEHFHEFAMGLQADEKGNLYYSKGARHAKPAIVPHHGTLLRVSADGSRTDILASGFRAANGICLNPDGTFFLTDQEGEWTPKNRINLVHGKGPSEFFGNMLGYHDITDESDAAMSQPLCWITNRMDRSPAELLWVPSEAKWGNLGGSLLNLSYGYGMIYTVPYELIEGQPQGGVCALPMPPFPTGIMRGRFHPDGDLFACGMFSWAGNRTQPGGLYRVRSTGKPAMQPVGLVFRKGTIRIRFSDPLDPSAEEITRHAVRSWHIRRTKRYGSNHEDEHDLKITGARLESPETLVLEVPDLQPTRCIEIRCRLKQADGFETERVIHGTIHKL